MKNTTKYVDTEDKGQQEKVVSMEFTGDKIGTGIITIYPKNCKNKQAVSSKVTVHIRADVQDAAFATVTELEEGKEQSVFGYIVSPAGKAEKIADIPKITTDQISFVSSNPEIATVDAKTGVVKAVKEGKVTISMEATNSIDGSKKTVKTLELDIVKPAVTDIIVTEKGSTRNYGTVSAGETIQLAISMIPQGSTDKVTYTSENPKVAKVDENGKITGVSAGTCKINVTTEKKGITKTFTVTVTAPASTPKPQATKKPAKITVSRVTGVKAVNQKGKKVKVSWKKLGSVKGYRITLALNKKFTSGKKVFLVNKGTTVSKVITKLKKGKTYYVKVEAYKVSGKKKIFGKASIIKKVLVKK